MIKNYIITAFRNLWRIKFFSTLNIVGLAIGMASCLLILQYVTYEFSYDKFHENSKDIYRVQYNNYQNGRLEFACAAAVPAVGPAMKDNFPEVIEYARAFPVSGIITYKDKKFRQKKMQIATPSFINMLSFPLIKGDAKTALKDVHTAVITEETAKKYFGDEDPLGKIISWNGRNDFKITGILKDIPDNSHIKFSVLLSFSTLNEFTEDQSETAWGWYDFNTYVQLKSGSDPLAFNEKFQKWLEENRGEEWKNRNVRQEFLLQPIEEIHLYSDLLQESEPQENGDGDSVFFLLIIAFFILFIAWVNFINLSTSRSIERAKEVGLRKVIGASKKQLIRQFIFESLLVNIIAAILSIFIVGLVLPNFNSILDSKLSFQLINEPRFWISLTGLFLFGAFLSGLYPAFILSSYKPALVLKGKFSSNKSGIRLRKALVIFQFSASIFLITGTITVYDQLMYMRNYDLGIDIDQTLVIRGPGVTDSTYNGKLVTFKNELLNYPKINNFTCASNVPGDEIFWATSVRKVEDNEDQGQIIYIIGMDDDYVPMFNLKVVAGRNFSHEFKTEEDAVIINESAVDLLGFTSNEEAINRKVMLHGKERTIVGVINNYNQMSLKTATIPLIYRYFADHNEFFALKLNTIDIHESIDLINNKWNEFFSENPFDYFFLDEFYNQQYKNDAKIGNAAGIFAFLAVVIASLGLFALAALNTLQRTKEIGIRKVLGAKVSTISTLLSKDFLTLIIWAIIITAPISYFILDKWLNNFAYRIDVGWKAFILSALAVIIIAFLAISSQIIKSVRVNPVETLKYE